MQQTQSNTSVADLVKTHKLLASAVPPEQIKLYEQEKAKFLSLSNEEVIEMIKKNSADFENTIDTVIAIAVFSVDKEELKQKVLISSEKLKQKTLAAYNKIAQEIVALEGDERFDKYTNSFTILYKAQISDVFKVVKQSEMTFWEKFKETIFG